MTSSVLTAVLRAAAESSASRSAALANVGSASIVRRAAGARSTAWSRWYERSAVQKTSPCTSRARCPPRSTSTPDGATSTPSARSTSRPSMKSWLPCTSTTRTPSAAAAASASAKGRSPSSSSERRPIHAR
jgi:hypothetical protein